MLVPNENFLLAPFDEDTFCMTVYSRLTYRLQEMVLTIECVASDSYPTQQAMGDHLAKMREHQELILYRGVEPIAARVQQAFAVFACDLHIFDALIEQFYASRTSVSPVSLGFSGRSIESIRTEMSEAARVCADLYQLYYGTLVLEPAYVDISTLITIVLERLADWEYIDLQHYDIEQASVHYDVAVDQQRVLPVILAMFRYSTLQSTIFDTYKKSVVRICHSQLSPSTVALQLSDCSAVHTIDRLAQLLPHTGHDMLSEAAHGRLQDCAALAQAMHMSLAVAPRLDGTGTTISLQFPECRIH